MKKIIVNKFGGEIMGSKEHNQQILAIIKDQLSNGYQVIIIVSALSGITDKLLSSINYLLKKNGETFSDDFSQEIMNLHLNHAKGIYKLQKSIDTYQEILQNEIYMLKDSLNFIKNYGYINFISDKIVSTGEKLSANFLNILINENNIKAVKFTGEELGIITDDNYEDANINYELASMNIIEKLNIESKVSIIAGFTGIDKQGRTTTLGRGGSDTTACFIGSALLADKIILWKTVNGVLTSDPRIVKGTHRIDYLTYNEAEESGKVVCSKAIEYLRINKINMEVASITDPNQRTLIGYKKNTNKSQIKLLSYVNNCSLLKIKSVLMTKPGFLHQISSIFYEFKVNMCFIRNTRDVIYIAIENNQDNIEKVFEKLKKFSHLKVEQCCIINIIGNLTWELASKVNKELKLVASKSQIGVFPHVNCVRLEAIVNCDELEKILNYFHEKFIN